MDLRIFMIEDNQGDVLLMREAFAETGANVAIEVRPDGDHAIPRLLELAREGELPDLIVLNVNLPRLPGPEVLRRIKQHPELRHVPTVMLTSSGAERDRARCSEADGYLVKASTWEATVGIARQLAAYLVKQLD